MVADIVSADYGPLRSLARDGTKSVRVLHKPRKNRDGYFCCANVKEMLRTGMEILKEADPESPYQYDEHVFALDNATTHLKRADNALSARHMSKGMSQRKTNFSIKVTVIGENGQTVYGTTGHPLESVAEDGRCLL
jgi:DNA polymerase elongation subunit (family B)